MILRILLCALAVPTAQVLAQPPRPNAVYVEAFGNSPIVSVNYERGLAANLGVRIGVGRFPNLDPGEDPELYGFPIMVHYRIGRRILQPEFGIGVTMEYRDTRAITGEHDIDPVEVMPTATLGVRFVPAGSPLLLRSGFTPVLSGGKVWPWIGASVGLTF